MHPACLNRNFYSLHEIAHSLIQVVFACMQLGISLFAAALEMKK